MAEHEKRVYIFAGHYGSGKTNIAVNFALALKRQGAAVKIADLDIVNPYFRTKDSASELEAAGIELISPMFANSNVDLPALPPQLYGLVQRRDTRAVIDVGGDDRGAYALGRFAPSILEENDYEMCFVANFYRPLTATAAEALEVMREIEQAGGVPFTCIINNSNLGGDTSTEAVRATAEKAEELSAMSGLPILFTSARADLAAELDAFPLELQKKLF